MGYLLFTRFLLLVIAINKDSNVCICINRAHAFGMFVTIRKGAILNILKKLGLVITSSTKTEVVANEECFPKYS